MTNISADLIVEYGAAWHRAQLSRPDRRNVLTPQLIDALGRAITDCENDLAARAFVIESSGSVFCDGMDLAAAAQNSQVRGAGGEAFVHLLDRFTTADVAVICVVDGRATGGGVGLAAACDFVFATPRSSFCLPEALWGLVPCLVAPFLIRRAGYRLCQQMALSTIPIDVDSAKAAGLVDTVEDQPQRSMQLLLNRLRRTQPGSIGAAKRYFRTLWPLDDRTLQNAIDSLEGFLIDPGMVNRLQQFADNQQLPWQPT